MTVVAEGLMLVIDAKEEERKVSDWGDGLESSSIKIATLWYLSLADSW